MNEDLKSSDNSTSVTGANESVGVSTDVIEKTPHGEEDASTGTPNDVETKRAQNSLVDGEESEQLHEKPRSSDLEDKPEQGGEPEAPETSEQNGQKQSPNDDDDNEVDEVGSQVSEISDEFIADSAQPPERPKRYELSYWPYHLTEAEKLWTTEERVKSDEWNELWKLVVRFLCEDLYAFKLWQKYYMDLGDKYIPEDILLSPLQVAAAYGIPALVKILLDRGESAAAELEDGRSALWFGADSPNIEVITLLLEKGANPNARKDFETPFQVVLRCNPKIEFVNTMLKHGADCNIADQWGRTAMHWFAYFGSDVAVFEVLIRADADINVTDSDGETPLHALMYNSDGSKLDLLHAFLENGADVNKDDKESQSQSP